MRSRLFLREPPSMQPARVLKPVAPSADDDVLDAARHGDARAQEILYRRHAAPLLATVTRLLGVRADAEDVLHDTFLLAFQRLEQLREPGALQGWLLQIAVSFVYRRSRRLGLLRKLGFGAPPDASLLELAADGLSPEQHAELVLLQKTLDRLSPTTRVPWMLRNVEGYALQEVADACECSLATTKRRIAEADAFIARELHRPEASDV